MAPRLVSCDPFKAQLLVVAGYVHVTCLVTAWAVYVEAHQTDDTRRQGNVLAFLIVSRKDARNARFQIGVTLQDV